MNLENVEKLMVIYFNCIESREYEENVYVNIKKVFTIQFAIVFYQKVLILIKKFFLFHFHIFSYSKKLLH